MLSAKGSALVAGSTTSTIMQKTQHVKVVRAFMHHGKPQPAGAVVEVSEGVARELVAMNKAVNYEPKAKPAPRPAEVDAPKEQSK